MCALTLADWASLGTGQGVPLLEEQGAFSALVGAVAARSDDTAFALQMLGCLSSVVAVAVAARALAREPTLVENLALLMRTHTHSQARPGLGWAYPHIMGIHGS